MAKIRNSSDRTLSLRVGNPRPSEVPPDSVVEVDDDSAENYLYEWDGEKLIPSAVWVPVDSPKAKKAADPSE